MKCQAFGCKKQSAPQEFYCKDCLTSFKEGKKLLIKENGTIKEAFSCAYEDCPNPRGINSIFCFKHLVKEFFFSSASSKSRKDLVYEFIKKNKVVRRKEIANFLEVKTQHLSYSLMVLLKTGVIKRVKKKKKTYYLIED